VPAGLEGVVSQLVVSPTFQPAGDGLVRVASTIPQPGTEASLATKVSKSGDTMTGPLVLDNAALLVRDSNGASVFNVDPPSRSTSAVTVVASNASLSSMSATNASVSSLWASSGGFNTASVSSLWAPDAGFNNTTVFNQANINSAWLGAANGGTATFSGDVTGAHLIATS
jgi:hypothetical protein